MTHNIMGIDPCDAQNQAVFNVSAQKRTFVDQRTGLFEAYVPLPSVTGNAGCGPVVDMGLFYSPVVNNQAGLGDGWSFAFTTYDEGSSKLTLHTGEILSVKKNENLNVSGVWITWDEKEKTLSVLRKDGRKEKLKAAGKSKIYVPETILDDTLNKLSVTWNITEQQLDNVTHYQIKLAGIKDSARELLRVNYTASQAKDYDACAEVIFWPDSTEKMSFELRMKEYALKAVVAPEQTSTTLSYLDCAKCGWLLTEIISFDGLRETVGYKDNGLKFDDNPKLTQLPCVELHTITPIGAGCERTVCAYKYERLNDKRYKTTLSYKAKDSSVVRTESYLYGADHNLLEEIVDHSGSSIKKEYTQESDGLLTTVTYQDKDRGSPRKETFFSAFDERGCRSTKDGVLNYLINDNGAALNSDEIHTDIGPAIGYRCLAKKQAESAREARYLDVLCKMDRDNQVEISGFDGGYARAELTMANKKLFKDPKFCMPFELSGVGYVGSYLDQIVLLKYHSYQKRLGRVGNKLSRTLTMVNAIGDIKKSAWLGQWFSYYGEEDFRCGRKKTVEQGTVSERGELADPTEPAYTYEYSLSKTELTTTTKARWENDVRESSQTHSVLSGRLLAETDADGNKSVYSYDDYGRLNKKTVCAQNETYKASTSFSYPTVSRLEITEPNGLTKAIEYDGRGNITQELQRFDNPKTQKIEWIPTLAINYDALGRTARIEKYDSAGTVQISEWCNIKYDNWGEECGRDYSNGTKEYYEYNPVKLSKVEGKAEAGDDRTLTLFNADMSIKSIEEHRLSRSNGTRTFSYNEAGKLTNEIVSGELGKVSISYAYDGIGRVLKETHAEYKKDEASACLEFTYHYTYAANWLSSEPLKIEIEADGKRLTLGERHIDGWGRVTTLSRGANTEAFTFKGASTVPFSRKIGDTTFTYEYIKELGNRLSTVKSSKGGTQTLTYSYNKHSSSSAVEDSVKLDYKHADEFKVSKQSHGNTKTGKGHALTSSCSIGGRLLSEVDAQGNESTFTYNELGQRVKTVSKEVVTQHVYNNKGQLKSETLTLTDKKTLPVAVEYEYDLSLREVSRHYKVSGSVLFTLATDYHLNGNLRGVELKQKDKVLASRGLEYDANSRVVKCSVKGAWMSKTPKNNKNVDSQTFTYDALGNVKTCISNVVGGNPCTSTYTYDTLSNSRLEKVDHAAHPDYPATATLQYDSEGRVTQDQNGKKYSYDGLGRLIKAGSSVYTYDPLNRFMGHGEGQNQRHIVYDGLQVRGEIDPTDTRTGRYLSPGSAACTVQRVRRSEVDRLLLEMRDFDGTVLVSYDLSADTMKHHAYSAYGEHFSEEKDSLLGFNGEFRDPNTDQYPLGQGYRWYAPDSMQFHAQDSLSPFGLGGPQAYGYCNGNPANLKDRTGHFSVNNRLYQAWGGNVPKPLGLGSNGPMIGTVLWAGLGVLTAIFSGGVSLLLHAALIAAAVVAMALAVTAVLIKDTNPALASILTWVSFGFTMAGGVGMLARKVSLLLAQLGRASAGMARKLMSNLKYSAWLGRSNVYKVPKLSVNDIGRPINRWNFLGNSGGASYESAMVNFAKNSTQVPVATMWLAPATATSNLASAGGKMSIMQRFWAQGLESLDLDDLNSVICGVTGVLGNSGYFDSERAAEINANINNLTWTPWTSAFSR